MRRRQPGPGYTRLRALSTLLLGLIGCTVLPLPDEGEPGPGHQPPDQSTGAVIVAVEGLSFVNTLLGELMEITGMEAEPMDDRDTYLSLALTALLSDPDYKISSFPWSGNATGDTAKILEDRGPNSLRQFLREKKDYAESLGLPLVVVGHSWGTVLTYLALSLEAAEPDPLEVDLYITLSSPLGTRLGHPGTYPEEAVIDSYLEDWLETLNFETTSLFRPRAATMVNFWAWGDLISGPLEEFVPAETGVTDIRVDEGLFDRPLDTDFSRTAAYSNRNLLDAQFWHKFTTADPVVLGDEYMDYRSQDFIRDVPTAFHAFLADLRFYIHGASGRPRTSPHDLRIEVAGITVIHETEGDGFLNPADDAAEYFGYITLAQGQEKKRIKRIRSEHDNISLETGDYYPLNWRPIMYIDDPSEELVITAEFYEDELGDDLSFPGIYTRTISLSGPDRPSLPHEEYFDVSWKDSTQGENTLRLHLTIAPR
ncbi:hypothetical protein [Spirochaeta lutea]|uniref:Uncharacterized protein n=1 Tax=Spirochaeta lutea TaxID=1480694 RepID=A0A098QW44_9SPIO|nr:hypothetical protein [Spirochaeta lutea]KGE72075.1 hypothetical protein DC28_08215 [Spirochaeta lutea]